MSTIRRSRRGRRLARLAVHMLAIASPALSAPVSAADRSMRDIFIGTLGREGSDIVLTRCDLSEHRYVLVDAPGAAAVADAARTALPAYGEVVGSYRERDGRAILQVDRIDQLTPGRNCHLAAAIGQKLATAKASVPDRAFVGHYYLSGVRETGSELLLDPNGTFEWSMSYGAVDQAAHGTWQRQGDRIVLTTAQPTVDRPLFAYLKTAPWTAEAEQDIIRRQYEAIADTVRAACPFRTDGWVSSPPTIAIDDGTPRPSAIMLRQQADRTRAAAIAARTRVERLAQQVMAKPASQRADADVTEAAQHSLSDWLTAKDEAQQAAGAAGLADPGLNDPTLPAACIMPAMKNTGDDPKTWTGGLGVRVSDPGSGQGARDVRIALRFADGRVETLVTARDGRAILPRNFAKGAVGATLHADYAQGRDATFTFAPVTSGILQFSIDASQLTEPPFATLTLTISGTSLIATDLGSGRYVRQP